MKDYQLNTNREFVNRIIEGIIRKDGHCPCRKLADDTTLCPCDDFIENKNCVCGLFVKRESLKEQVKEKEENK